MFSGKKDNQDKASPEVTCPICLNVPADPVLGLDGTTYGRDCLEEYIRKGGKQFPVGKQKIPLNYDPTPNVGIRQFTDPYLKKEQIESRQKYYTLKENNRILNTNNKLLHKKILSLINIQMNINN